MYGNLPMYPGHCMQENGCMRVPLFQPGERPPREPGCDIWSRRRPGDPPACHRPRPCRPECDFHPEPPVSVRLRNPWDACEQVTVSLSVDPCGNLLVCIRRS